MRQAPHRLFLAQVMFHGGLVGHGFIDEPRQFSGGGVLVGGCGGRCWAIGSINTNPECR